MNPIKRVLSKHIELWLGDFREVLPLISTVDAVITDPPYGIKHKGASSSIKSAVRTDSKSISSVGKRFDRSIVGDDVKFEPKEFLFAEDVLFTGAQHFYDKLPSGGSLHVWDKRGEYKPLDQADADIIWHNKPGQTRTLYCVWRGLCRHVENTEKIEHPTQKPIGVMEFMIQKTKAKLILDPYMGSGTTGVAAINLDRRFIGIEIVEEYFEVACRRIGDAIKKKEASLPVIGRSVI